jgi:nucleotide-binding universal stress UspA family protein
MRIVAAAKPGTDQPWIADAVAGRARQTGATVTVVAADGIELERLAAAPRDLSVARAAQAAAALAERLVAAGIEATSTVVAGRPQDAIREYADTHQADLIVVGATTKAPIAERLVGSVPLDLIKHARRPVLVVTKPA